MLKYVDKEYCLPYQQTKNVVASSSATAATPMVNGEWTQDGKQRILGLDSKGAYQQVQSLASSHIWKVLNLLTYKVYVL